MDTENKEQKFFVLVFLFCNLGRVSQLASQNQGSINNSLWKFEINPFISLEAIRKKKEG